MLQVTWACTVGQNRGFCLYPLGTQTCGALCHRGNRRKQTGHHGGMKFSFNAAGGKSHPFWGNVLEDASDLHFVITVIIRQL